MTSSGSSAVFWNVDGSNSSGSSSAEGGLAPPFCENCAWTPRTCSNLANLSFNASKSCV